MSRATSRSSWLSDPADPDDAMTDLCRLAQDLRRITVEVRNEDGSRGSGILWPAGHIVTNAHVARRARTALAFSDGHRFEGRLVARDEHTDLALLRVEGGGFCPAVMADPSGTRVGSLVVAMGHPLGVHGALTIGIIHAIGPVVPGGRRWIQADLRLAPGNSGGPIADAAGRLVGVNTMIAGTLALAIPMAEVKRFVLATGMRSG